ncbi:MAG: hypothetical protein LBR52_00025 [Prevotellaceae bacterium]|jgi:hypothetical protein|nr:hypothetical protein [Prevotellaceae bacterium]
MKTMKSFKVLIAVIMLLWVAGSALAQDVITLMWKAEAGSYRYMAIQATIGEEFTVNWGDGTIETGTSIEDSHDGRVFPTHIYDTDGEYTVTVTASNSNCRFTYFDCMKANQATSLDVSGCSALQELRCSGNELTSLDVSGCSALQELRCSGNQLTRLDLTDCVNLNQLYCNDNKLQLSELYAAHLKINTQNNKVFSTQYLPSQAVIVGEELFSAQSVFDSTFTNYSVVTKNGDNALADDYTVVDGKLVFNTIGSYIVTMTNTAIVSYEYNQAKVIVGINVIEPSEISVEPSDSSALFVWEAVGRATGYELRIYSDAEYRQTVCIIEFDADGNYVGTKSLRSGTGDFSYEVKNLTAGTDYYYVITANIDETSAVLQENSFTTTGNPVGIAGEKDFSPAAQAIGYYRLTGLRLPQEPASGIYIIVYSNGKVEKVMK